MLGAPHPAVNHRLGRNRTNARKQRLRRASISPSSRTGVTVAVLKICVPDQRAPFHVPRCRHSLYYGLRHLGLFGQRSSSCCAQTLPPAAAAHPALDDRLRDRSGETSGWIWSWTWFSSACLATRHRRVSFRKGGHTSLARAANKNNGKAW